MYSNRYCEYCSRDNVARLPYLHFIIVEPARYIVICISTSELFFIYAPAITLLTHWRARAPG